jgi:hypothetical protein
MRSAAWRGLGDDGASYNLPLSSFLRNQHTGVSCSLCLGCPARRKLSGVREMTRRSTSTGIIIWALLSFGFPTRGQSGPTIPVPHLDPGRLGSPGFRFANDIPQLVNLIPSGDGARSGHIWVGDTGKSLRILGVVDGGQPDWPKDKNTILSKDHVEVWLAGPDDVQLPPLEWGSEHIDAKTPDECKFDPSTPGTEDDEVQKCETWFDAQRTYRAALNRLFVRQWILAEGQSAETFASPAYEAIAGEYGAPSDGVDAPQYPNRDLSVLKPHGDVRFRSIVRPGIPGYRFEIDIPYASFPPLHRTELSDMRLMIDVFSAAPPGRREGAYSTTSATRAYGKPETFGLFHLDTSIVFQTSPCRSPLESEKYVNTLGYAEKFPAWFIPAMRTPHGYQTDAFLVGLWRDQDIEISPMIFPFHYFWRSLGTSEWVCGPDLAYRKGNTIRSFSMSVAEVFGPGQADKNVAEVGFEVKRRLNGQILIKVGPRLSGTGGMGQCGGCPWSDLSILGIDGDSNLITLLSLRKQIDGDSISSQDFSISPDWSRVVEYDATGEDGERIWSSVTYCLRRGRYEQCGVEKKGVKPPYPAFFKQLREIYENN